MIPVADQVALAVAYERERCAMIAEVVEECAASKCCGARMCDAGGEIAAKIRIAPVVAAAEPVVSVVVLLNPTTKQPTCFEPNEATSRIFYGPYQNVTRVTKEWQDAERKAFDDQEYQDRQHLREMMAG